MSMESTVPSETRWSARRRVQLQVEVYCAGRPCVNGVTRDVGLGGMFIEGRGIQFRCNRPLEVVVSGTLSGKPYSHRFHAKLVRHNPRGLGVAFSRYGLDDVRALQRLL